MSWGAALVAVSLASTAYSAYSQYAAGEAEERAEKRRAKELRYRYGVQAAQAEKEHRRLIATQKARYGASGLTMEGTPLLVQMESLKESEEELARIRTFGEMAAGESELLGKLARRAGYARAGGELLGGTARTMRTYYDWFGS